MVAAVMIFQRDDGFFDREGNRYNEEGQRLDETGNVVVDEDEQQRAREEEEARLAREEQNPVERHGLDIARQDENGGVARQEGGVARHDAQNRTLADFNRPEQFYANRAAIQPPAFQRNDFELKPAYFSFVAQDPYCGLPHEHPMDHIERFEDLASSIKANGVSQDYLFCKLFPYSLHGEAKHWLRTLPPGSLTTWEDTKNAFLSNFFDDAKSEDLRYKITTFRQGDQEAFKAAWHRFKGYQRDCPHHGFNEVQLLSIFFRGIAVPYAVSLDAASKGDFNTNSPEAAFRLIENLANSNSTKNLDFERSKSGQSISGNQLAEVTKKIDSMHSLLAGKKSVHFAQDVENAEEDVNYLNQAGFQKYGSSFYQKPFQSYNRDYGSSSYQKSPPPSSNSRMESMVEQLLEGQQKLAVDWNGKFDSLYTDLNGKIEALTTHVRKLDVQVAQTAESVRRQEGFLPAKTDSNPKRACNAIRVAEDDYFDEFEAIFETEDSVSIDTGDACRSTREESAVSEIEALLSSDRDSSVDRQSSSVARHVLQAKSVHPKAAPIIEESIHKPKLPFPKAKKSKQEAEEAICKRMIEKIMVEMPLVDAIKLSPAIRRYVKRMVSIGVSPEEAALLTRDLQAILLSTSPISKKKKKGIMVSAEVSAMIQSRIPVKLPDPGSFVLNCSISEECFPHSLCDSGSGINLMPLSVATRLGMTEFMPTRMSLLLADRSRRFPKGVLRDVLIKIQDCMIPADFVVLEYDEEPQDPLILGRSFLATAGANIDCRRGKIKLDLGDVVMEFDMDNTRRRSTIDGQAFSVEDSLEDEQIQEPSEDSPTVLIQDLIATVPSSADSQMEPRYESPVLNSISSNFINVEKAVTHSRKPRVLRKLGFSDEITGKKKEEVKPKRTSKPFARLRIIVPPELNEKGEAVLQEMMERTMRLFPETAKDKSGGVHKKVYSNQAAASSSKDKGSTVLPKDPH